MPTCRDKNREKQGARDRAITVAFYGHLPVAQSLPPTSREASGDTNSEGSRLKLQGSKDQTSQERKEKGRKDVTEIRFSERPEKSYVSLFPVGTSQASCPGGVVYSEAFHAPKSVTSAGLRDDMGVDEWMQTRNRQVQGW